MTNITSTILALDVGEARIGLAAANSVARLASPHSVITNDADVMTTLKHLCASENVNRLVIGLPRGLDGQDTDQTARAKAFGERLERELQLPISWQDEAVTSVHAETELRARGKAYSKGDIDALAATYILEDYLRDHL